jgi:hypothetical protein
MAGRTTILTRVDARRDLDAWLGLLPRQSTTWALDGSASRCHRMTSLDAINDLKTRFESATPASEQKDLSRGAHPLLPSLA